MAGLLNHCTSVRGFLTTAINVHVLHVELNHIIKSLDHMSEVLTQANRQCDTLAV